MISIRAKLISIIGIGLVMVLVSIYALVDYFYAKNVRIVATEHLKEAQELFNEHLQFDTEKLTAIVRMFERDEEFKKLFAARDREALYRKGQPLYAMLNESYGITHFYFHLPDGTNFLRLHSKELHSDMIARETFKTAVVTGRLSMGIELGKTAFALRVVAPYYYKAQLIGYVEIGEEIDHFIEFLKRTKNEDFAIIAEKHRLGKEEFIATNALRGLPNTWDLMTKHVWIGMPSDKFLKSGYLSESNIQRFEHEPAIVSENGNSPSGLIFGGFPLNDIQRKHVGAVISLMDISRQVQALSDLKMVSLAVLLVLTTMIFALVYFMSGRWIVSPLQHLLDATKIFARGELRQHRIDYQSNDEIGHLAVGINEMAEQLNEYCSGSADRSHKLEQLNTKLESLAITDDLTGLFNHRHLFTRIKEEIHRANRYSRPLSFIIADIDNFKTYNDSYGHLDGDIVLKKFAAILSRHARDTDIIARFGGDEFAIILPETDLITALGVAERIREIVSAEPFPHAAMQPDGILTASFGVATHSDEAENYNDLIGRADKALYKAKESGRNRVMTI